MWKLGYNFSITNINNRNFMKLNSILLIILITLNHGCFNDMDVMEEEVQMGSFPQTCQLNAERLKLILEEVENLVQ